MDALVRNNHRVIGWVLLPLLTWMLAHALLIRPAQNQLALAQQELFEAERENLRMEQALQREDSARTRLERERRELADTAERMTIAERDAEAQLASLNQPGLANLRTVARTA